ncbi:MobA/MobL family protein [Shewanella loihica]|uniref:MobA/MobL family protein n=1 Tax=Shewanella loihica TaxID=359303 RepID=UPI001232559B|nr:MobA/MobL family protein [Shewanella loihica]
MAIFFLRMNPVSRQKKLPSGKIIKQSATAGAAYRAAEKIVDQRTGKVSDYTQKKA